MNLQDRLFSRFRDHNLLPADAVLVVGVSGGTDSLALMHALAGLRASLAITIHVATLDHGLRGDAGAGDARFVADLARAWGLEVTAGYTSVRALAAERRIGIEVAARIARYDFLASVAAQVGAHRIAVAHHADDQVETVLHHLLRGSSLAGMAGMTYSAPLPGHPDLILIRPLLDVPRAYLEAYCHQHGLQPRHDASNEDVSLTRNRLRREVIPYLRELSPQIERHLLQLAEIAALEDDFADSALHAELDPHIARAPGRMTLPRAIFSQLHPALQRRFVVWAAQALGAAQDVGFVHITAAVEIALTGQVGARAQLKGGVQLRVDYQSVVVEHQSAPITTDLPLLPPGAVFAVAIPGTTSISEGWALETSLTPFAGQSPGTPLAIPERSAVLLRGRRQGDQFAPVGLHGHRQKLTKWMIDHKVPVAHRDQVPLLVVDDQIAMICWNSGFTSEHFVATAAAAHVVYYAFSPVSELS